MVNIIIATLALWVIWFFSRLGHLLMLLQCNVMTKECRNSTIWQINCGTIYTEVIYRLAYKILFNDRIMETCSDYSSRLHVYVEVCAIILLEFFRTARLVIIVSYLTNRLAPIQQIMFRIHQWLTIDHYFNIRKNNKKQFFIFIMSYIFLHHHHHPNKSYPCN